jgi:hypothetical protein
LDAVPYVTEIAPALLVIVVLSGFTPPSTDDVAVGKEYAVAKAPDANVPPAAVVSDEYKTPDASVVPVSALAGIEEAAQVNTFATDVQSPLIKALKKLPLPSQYGTEFAAPA